MKKVILLALISAVILLLGCSQSTVEPVKEPVMEDIYEMDPLYVSENGSSSGDGTLSNPFDNVQSAIDEILSSSAYDGATVTIHVEGTITKGSSSNGMVNISDSSRSPRITIQGYGLGGVLDAGSTVTIHDDKTVTDTAGGLKKRVMYINLPNGEVTFGENLTLTGGYTTSNGGAVYISRGAVTLAGATLQGNRSEYGGAVYVMTSSTSSFTMTSGIISGNYGRHSGGIYAMGSDSVTTISGGEISGNASYYPSYGAGIAGGVYGLSGGVVLKDNYTVRGILRNTSYASLYLVGPLTVGADIRIYHENASSGAVVAEPINGYVIQERDLNCLVNERTGGSFGLSGGNIVISYTPVGSLYVSEYGSASGDGTKVNPFDNIQSAIDMITEDPSYERKAVTINVEGTVTKGSNIDNMYKSLVYINSKQSVSITIQGYGSGGVLDAGSVTVIHTDKTATVTPGESQKRVMSVLLPNGELILGENLTLTGGYTTGAGGCVYVWQGAVTLAGATLKGNYSAYGGTVYIYSSTTPSFTMTSGVIRGNYGERNGGIYNTRRDLSVTISGGEIAGNASEKSDYATGLLGYPFEVCGSVVLKDNYITNGTLRNSDLSEGPIYLSGPLTDGADIGIYPESTSSGTVVVSPINGYEIQLRDLNYITNDIDGSKFELNSGNITLPLKTDYYVSEYGSSSGDGTLSNPFDNVQSAIDEILSVNAYDGVFVTIHVEGTITKGSSHYFDMVRIVDESRSPRITIQGYGAGGTLDAGSMVVINADKSVTATPGGLKKRCLYVYLPYGETTLGENLTLTGGYYTGAGGGVFVDKGAVTLAGATIKGNYAQSGGGAIYNDNSSSDYAITITGGEITGNASQNSSYGAGLAGNTYNLSGSVVLKDNYISNGTLRNTSYSNLYISGPLTDGADIGIYPKSTSSGTVVAEPVGGYVIRASDLNYLKDDRTGGSFVRSGGAIVVP